jgi:hypothetical protein
MIVQVKEQENMMDDIERDDVSDLEGGCNVSSEVDSGDLKIPRVIVRKMTGWMRRLRNDSVFLEY